MITFQLLKVVQLSDDDLGHEKKLCELIQGHTLESISETSIADVALNNDNKEQDVLMERTVGNKENLSTTVPADTLIPSDDQAEETPQSMEVPADVYQSLNHEMMLKAAPAILVSQASSVCTEPCSHQR